MEPEHLQFGTILVATELQRGSTPALRYAQALAGRHGAKLILADVVDPVQYAFECGEAEYSVSEKNRRVEIARIVSDIRVQGMVAETIPGRNAICDGIADAAAKHGADLLILGTRGHDEMSRLALGRIGRELLGKTRSCLLTVPGTAEVLVPSAGAPRRVLAATDMSLDSLDALRSARRMIHGGLTLLHVGRWRSGHECLNFLERLRDASPAHEWRAQQVDHVVVQGEAADAIADYARKVNADLILLGQPVRAGSLESSTVRQVITRVGCPVLCIPLSAPAKAGVDQGPKRVETVEAACVA